MPDFGITDEGFNRKRLDQILEELDAEMRLVFGATLDLSPESPDGQVNGIISKGFADVWELAEGAYNAYNPNSASGVTLSNLVQINGITRQEAFPSRGDLTLGGTPNTTVPSGSRVSSSLTGSSFVTTETAIIGGGGTIVVTAESEQDGPIDASAGDIDTIDTPIAGWNTVTNAADFILGGLEETDTQLRARRKLSVSRQGIATVESILAEVFAVEGVVSVTILENPTGSVDANGQDPYSVQVIALGGSDEDVAAAIFNKMPAGVSTFGTTTINVQDTQGFLHPINFTRPTAIPIYVDVTTTAEFNYPADGDDQIIQAIIDYANGELIDGRGFSLNEDVIYSELYTPVNQIPGHVVTDLRIGTSPSPTGTANITIAIGEIASFLTANITVTS